MAAWFLQSFSFTTHIDAAVGLLKSCNQCIQVGTFGGMVQEKGSRERRSSWTVLHAQCTSALSSMSSLSQGNDEAQHMWGGKTKHRLIAYFLSKHFRKNYCNRIVYVKSKVGRFLDTVYYCCTDAISWHCHVSFYTSVYLMHISAVMCNGFINAVFH